MCRFRRSSSGGPSATTARTSAAAGAPTRRATWAISRSANRSRCPFQPGSPPGLGYGATVSSLSKLAPSGARSGSTALGQTSSSHGSAS